MDYKTELEFIVNCNLYSKRDVAFILQIDRTTLARWQKGTEPDDLHKLKITTLHKLAKGRLNNA